MTLDWKILSRCSIGSPRLRASSLINNTRYSTVINNHRSSGSRRCSSKITTLKSIHYPSCPATGRFALMRSSERRLAKEDRHLHHAKRFLFVFFFLRLQGTSKNSIVTLSPDIHCTSRIMKEPYLSWYRTSKLYINVPASVRYISILRCSIVSLVVSLIATWGDVDSSVYINEHRKLKVPRDPFANLFHSFSLVHFFFFLLKIYASMCDGKK